MKITNFFIKHPVISIMLNSMIMFIGLLCLKQIDVREYPRAESAILTILSYYPNASSELVEHAITNPLEEQLAGIEGLDNMTSESKNGCCNITLNFRKNISIDRALSVTKDAIESAKPFLPKEVLSPTVRLTGKSNGLPFIAIAITSQNLSFSEVTHYANLYLKNAFSSLSGVATTEVWGQPFSMIIQLDPHKLFALGINADEVYDALEQRNKSLPVGKIKNTIPATLDLNVYKVSDFENLFIKNNSKGHPILLKFIADIKLATEDEHSTRVHINGQPGVVIAIYKTEDANPLKVSKEVKKKINILKNKFAIPINVELFLNQSDFIKSSLENLKSSIIEAILLVLLVVFLFLRETRSTIIPLITIPISLLGSLILLNIFGFSINTITLLAMLLAIGLVVDDAIIVLENIKRHIENGLNPLEAAIFGSREIGFAIVAMTLTLGVVYTPIIFIKGFVSKLFIEFAVALAGSIIVSGITALTLSPLMCSKIFTLKHKKFSSGLDALWKKVEILYANTLERVFIYTKHSIIIVISLFLIAITLCAIIPREIAPNEDRGLIGTFTPQTPDQDLNSLEAQAKLVENLLQTSNIIEAKNYLTFISNIGFSVVLPLKNHKDRKRSSNKILASLDKKFKSLPSIDIYGWSIDSGLPGIESSIYDRSSLRLAVSTFEDYRSLYNVIDLLRQNIKEKNLFNSVYHNLNLDCSAYKITIDPNIMAKLSITPLQIAKVIEIFFSGQRSLSFEKDHLRYPIVIKGKSEPWTLNELYITNPNNNRISLGAFVSINPYSTPQQLDHYNQMRTATLTVNLNRKQNVSSAIRDLSVIAKNTLPKNVQSAWQGFAEDYKQSANIMITLFGMGLVFVYAILSMQFENFLDPFIIMLTVPLAIFGAIFAIWVCGQSINIYTQIGLITLIGLITKHGILIVEFANKLLLVEPLETAIKKASLIRLRPILMTTSTMILGTLPLVLSVGAGAEARHAIGIVLIGGLIFGTIFTLFMLPQFYYLFKLNAGIVEWPDRIIKWLKRA